jgi:hypothetical protein
MKSTLADSLPSNLNTRPAIEADSACRYIKGAFFMDVHPPLAKMLIALVAWLAGFDGEFDFKDIGKYERPSVWL